VAESVFPWFTEDGLLPPGDYPMSISTLRASYLVTGDGVKSATWNAEWRALLVDNLAIMVGQLWQVGIEDIFVAGSFVEEKDHPNDLDGYFVCDLPFYAGGQLEQALNALEPGDPPRGSPSRNFRCGISIG
jgi:hypothetical protein